MKFKFSIRALFVLLFLGVLLFLPVIVCAQTPDNPFYVGTSVEEVFNWYTALYSGVIIALTRLQAAFFPNAGALPRTATRYVLIAGVVGVLFVVLGFTNAWGIVIGFVGSALTYDKLLEPLSNFKVFSFLKTPSPVQPLDAENNTHKI